MPKNQNRQNRSILNIEGVSALPTGAATSASQDTQVTSLQLIEDAVHEVNTTLIELGSVTLPLVIQNNYRSRSDTYTATGNGTAVSVATSPLKSFSIYVLSTGSVASAWDVRLEGSLDNVNFTQILAHTDADGDGVLKYTGASMYPSFYFRSRCAGLTLGAATNIVVTILGTA